MKASSFPLASAAFVELKGNGVLEEDRIRIVRVARHNRAYVSFVVRSNDTLVESHDFGFVALTRCQGVRDRYDRNPNNRERHEYQRAYSFCHTFVNPGDSGAKLSMYFYPTCGSSIFWEGGYSRSDVRGVAVGCFADPSFPPPQVAFFTENQHSWVTLPASTMPFETEPTETEVLALMDQLRGS